MRIVVEALSVKKNRNEGKGIAKPGTDELRQFNSYLEEVRGKLARHYRELLMQEKQVTTEAIKNAYLGKTKEQKNYTMLWLVKEDNTLMNAVFKNNCRVCPKMLYMKRGYYSFLDNAKEYYNVILKWLLYIIIVTYCFALLKFLIGRIS